MTNESAQYKSIILEELTKIILISRINEVLEITRSLLLNGKRSDILHP